MSNVQPFSISRVVNAPRKLVFLTHTDPAHLARWMGPPGFKVIKADMDLRVGGSYHYGLQAPDGSQMWGKQIYREIVTPDRLVFLQSFSDRDGGRTRHPMAATWPLEMLARMIFEEVGPDKTKVTVTWAPYNSDDAGNATFDGARAAMEQGFGGTFAKLEAHLAATERELVNSRVVDAPRELVWKAFTEPEHVNAWWGPDGFKNVDVEQDVRVGGVWRFKMVGPDGTEYPNQSTYLELNAPERLVYDHGDWNSVHFRAIVTLDEAGSGKTRVILNLVCPSREFRDSLLGFAVEGGQQTLAKLDVYLTKLK